MDDGTVEEDVTDQCRPVVESLDPPPVNTVSVETPDPLPKSPLPEVGEFGVGDNETRLNRPYMLFREPVQ